jgi:periplasmic divalent cation tolerance protein
MSGFSPGVVLCTCPDRATAESLAQSLVEKSFAACVNVLDGVSSFYDWEGRIESDAEVLLVIKTSREMFEELSGFIKREHPYDVPEIVFLPIELGSREYLDWMKETLK